MSHSFSGAYKHPACMCPYRHVEGAGGTGRANYTLLGDLITMGMNLTYSDKDVGAGEEVGRLKKRAGKKGMEVLDRAHELTYWPGSGSSYSPGNLDHVVAADHVQFKSFGGKPVAVRRWPEKTTNPHKDAWAKKYSDHAVLDFLIKML